MKKLAAVLLCLFAVAAVQAATYTVLNTNNAGPGSLRQAMLDAQASGVASTIAFNIPGSGVQTIALSVTPSDPSTHMPVMTIPVTFDGTTQPGYVSSPLIRVDGAAAVGRVIFDLAGGSSTMKAIEIKSGDEAIVLRTNGGDLIADCVFTNGSWRAIEVRSGNNDVIRNNRFTGSSRQWGVFVSGGTGHEVKNNTFTDVVFPINLQDTTGGMVSNNTITGWGAIGYPAIALEHGANSNTVRGNQMTNAASDATGIDVTGNSNTVDQNTLNTTNFNSGVSVSGSNNTITANTVSVSGSALLVGGGSTTPTNNHIANNSLGAQSGDCVVLSTGSGNELIGNTIVNCQRFGIRSKAGDNLVKENWIGIRPNGSAAGNGGGVFVEGGRTTITKNAIANNGKYKIGINQSLGIDLPPQLDFVNANDSGDGDSGANGLQNYPVLNTANALGGSVVVTGTLNSTPNSTFTIELFSNGACGPTGYGEGEKFVGSVSVTTDALGMASFSKSVTANAGSYITSTATSSSGGTSEFSACLRAAAVPPAISSVTPNNGPSTGGTSVTIAGSGFQPGVTVTFGGTPATVTSSSQSSISVTTPAHSEGLVDVTVVNPDSSSATANNAFAYTTCRPFITTQPQGATIFLGNSVTLNATAAGSAPLSYQWLSGKNVNGLSPIDGATSASLTISPTETTYYGVRVSNSCGNARSESAKVTVIDCSAVPTVTPDPPSGHVVMGNGAVLTADFNGATASSIQWYRVTGTGNEAIAGGTTNTLMTGPLSATTTFFAIATTECGVITTPQATVTVVAGRRRSGRR